MSELSSGAVTYRTTGMCVFWGCLAFQGPQCKSERTAVTPAVMNNLPWMALPRMALLAA